MPFPGVRGLVVAAALVASSPWPWQPGHRPPASGVWLRFGVLLCASCFDFLCVRKQRAKNSSTDSVFGFRFSVFDTSPWSSAWLLPLPLPISSSSSRAVCAAALCGLWSYLQSPSCRLPIAAARWCPPIFKFKKNHQRSPRQGHLATPPAPFALLPLPGDALLCCARCSSSWWRVSAAAAE